MAEGGVDADVEGDLHCRYRSGQASRLVLGVDGEIRMRAGRTGTALFILRRRTEWRAGRAGSVSAIGQAQDHSIAWKMMSFPVWGISG